MLFNSYIFIFLFFPICLLGFYGLKQKNSTLAKVWLTGFSLWFYGYFNIRYLCIMIFSILLNYGVYQLMMRVERGSSVSGAADKNADVEVDSTFICVRSKQKKMILITGVSANLLLLFYFKYYDFFVENINAVFGSSLVLKNVLLPLGISFFTFQQISFLADTYRGELKNCSFLDYALFVSFFPQLIAGPIVTHEEMLPQFHEIGKKKWNEEEFVRGLFIFVLGMGKKVLIADTFGIAVDAGYGMVAELGSIDAILVMLFYTLQLYFDFSGYCDMAIGIGKMMGIEIPINFNSPYKACNIIDFWKRWHITLSRFFTKNIYIPLGGNRKGQGRMYANLFFVFFLSGVWHGAGWNYIFWGVMHGVLYCVTRWLQVRKRTRDEQKEEKGSTEQNASANPETALYIRENAAGQNEYVEQGMDSYTETKAARQNQTVYTESKTTVKNWCLKGVISSRIIQVVKVLLTFIYVNIAWVFFRSESIEQALTLFKRMFIGGIALPVEVIYDAFNLDEFWYVMKVLHLTDFAYSNYILMVLFTVVILLVTFFGKNVHELAKRWKMSGISAVVIAVVFIWCVVSLSGVSTFLYFNF